MKTFYNRGNITRLITKTTFNGSNINNRIYHLRMDCMYVHNHCAWWGATDVGCIALALMYFTCQTFEPGAVLAKHVNWLAYRVNIIISMELPDLKECYI